MSLGLGKYQRGIDFKFSELMAHRRCTTPRSSCWRSADEDASWLNNVGVWMLG